MMDEYVSEVTTNFIHCFSLSALLLLLLYLKLHAIVSLPPVYSLFELFECRTLPLVLIVL